MKYAVPAMRKAGGGSIINISSGAGIIGTGMAAAYHGTKGAVRILTKTAAIEYAKDNIRINSVHPGVIDTEMVRGLLAEEGMHGRHRRRIRSGGLGPRTILPTACCTSRAMSLRL